ncbi:MAG: MobA/MobL family protein [Ruminiclostridium sp.]|nr:MobA/MobL family protein [Ruminiclostridium sp.]
MLRKSWADMQNRSFARLGLDARVSHESLSMQGIYRAPAPYLGVKSLALERKGVQTDRGDLYRGTARQNAKLRGLCHSLERGHGPTR